MIEDRIIVCIASSWDYDPTSKHHIMKILSRRNDVVWINYHGTRRPTLSRGDVRASVATLRRFLRGTRRVGPTFVQTTPLVIPGATGPIARKLHERLLIAQTRRAIRRVQSHPAKPVQIWSFAPDVPCLVGRFDEECFLYYCVDEYSLFDGVDRERLATLETEMIHRAGIVVTSSTELFDTKRAIRPDTVLMRHGVDYDHFASAWQSDPPRPDDLASVRAPMIGFFGLIQYWIDIALIAKLAALRPEYSFVLIGETKVDVSSLERRPNVYLLGRRSNADLPAYCAAFDVALMPFVCNAMTRNVNPIKMHEYLAAGLPVVSTPLPEAKRFRGPITLADSAEGFAAACDRLLAEDFPQRRQEISRVVESESWESKVELLSALVTPSSGRGFREASMPIKYVQPGAGFSPAPPSRPLNQQRSIAGLGPPTL